MKPSCFRNPRGGPETIELSPSGDPLELSSLDKKITKESDIEHWLFSPAYQYLDYVIRTLCQAVKSTPSNQEHTVNPVLTKIIDVFHQLNGYLGEIPPDPSPQRFGNRAFRIWLSKIWDNRATILSDITSNSEAQEYFCQSFGSWSRLDYGTGHEFNFVAFLSCLSALKLITITPEHSSDSLAIVFDVFPAYWELNIAVQKQYHLEAAGSHGAWGLDDFFSLPFVFGSSQLIKHSKVVPSNVVDAEVSAQYRNDSLYCEWICKLAESKGPIAEKSRILYSLRVLKNFEDLHAGMIRMYKGELMDRYLVMQHFRFGKILAWE